MSSSDPYAPLPRPVSSVPVPLGRDAGAPNSSRASPGGLTPPGAPGRLSSAGPPDAIELLGMLRRRWRLAAVGGLFLAMLAGATVYVLTPPPEYTSRALVHVAERRPRDLFETRESGVSYAIYQQTQATLIRSDRVLSAVIANPGIREFAVVRAQHDPVAWLRDMVRTDFGGSEILTISMSGEEPRVVAALVNAVTQAYLEQIVEQEHKERLERLGRLKELFGQYQEELRQKRQRYKEQAESLGAGSDKTAALRQQMAAEHLGQSRRELVRLQSEIRLAQARWKVLLDNREQAIARSPTAAEVEAVIDADPWIREAGARLAERRREQARLERIARRPGDPARQGLDREVLSMERALEERRRQLRPEAERRALAALAAPDDGEAERAEQYVEILREQERILAEEIAALNGEMGSFDAESMDLHWLDDEIKLASEVADTVGSEVEAVTVELQAPPRIRLIEPARPSGPADQMVKVKRGGMAAVAALGLFAAVVSLWEFRAQRIDRADEVEAKLGIGLVGALPELPRRDRGRRLDLRRRLMVESIDAIRTALLHTAQAESIQVVMVTSAMKGEGKSSLACNLATSLARAGRRTLLLDCDLRNPSAHYLLDGPLVPGFCEILRGEVGLDDALQETQARPLFLLSAGACDVSALDGLARAEARELFLTLRGRFDFIVVDSAPALLVADPLVVSQHVDAVLFSILRHVSRGPIVLEACERFASLGVRIVGAVVAGVACERHGYRQYMKIGDEG